VLHCLIGDIYRDRSTWSWQVTWFWRQTVNSETASDFQRTCAAWIEHSEIQMLRQRLELSIGKNGAVLSNILRISVFLRLNQITLSIQNGKGAIRQYYIKRSTHEHKSSLPEAILIDV
jgi:hypothetical protein